MRAALLTFILLVAFALRALRCAEGLPYLHQWDEPQTASTALRILKTGDFNPHFFNYGSLLAYLNVGVDAAHYLYLMTKPESDPASLSSLDEVRTERDSGYHWTISHPSFYFWNRMLTALMATGSILIVYFISRILWGSWAGILGAGLLAGVDYDITHSALVTPNVPSAFFGALAVLLALLYARRGGSAVTLVGSAAACGLAASTKYNAAVSIVCPLLVLAGAWWSKRPRPGGWLCVAVVLVPLLAFLAGTPYALLDLPTFVEHVGFEIRHYHVLGHGEETIEPGATNVLYQLRTMTEQIGLLPAAFALLGLGVSLASGPGRIAFAYPLVYLFLMSLARISFHRNFLVLYPFAAVAFGCGVMAAGEFLRTVRPGSIALKRARVALFVAAAALCIAYSAGSLLVSWRVATTRETRSLAIDKVNERTAGTGGAPRGGIAREVGIHELDLARLEVRYEVAPFFDLVCADRSRYDLLVTAAEMGADEPSQRPGADLMNSWTRALATDVTKVGRHRWLHLMYMNVDPGVVILSTKTRRGATPRCHPPLNLVWIDPMAGGREMSGREAQLGKVPSAATEWLAVAPGPHAFIWSASGRSKTRFEPQLKSTLRMRFGGIVVEREWKAFDLARMEIPYALTFEAPVGAEFSLAFEKSEGDEISLDSVRCLDLP